MTLYRSRNPLPGGFTRQSRAGTEAGLEVLEVSREERRKKGRVWNKGSGPGGYGGVGQILTDMGGGPGRGTYR